jgi:hypothetical protein
MWGVGSVCFDDICFSRVDINGDLFEKDHIIIQ